MLTAPPTTVQVNALDPNAAQNVSVQTPPQQTPQIPQQPLQSMPITPDMAHSAAVGHGFKSLMRSMMPSHTEYQQTPNGPVSTQVKDKPGQLFRSILAGAILGGANGGDSGSGWQAAASGARAVDQRGVFTDQVAQQRAQQQFENQQKAQQADRETQLLHAQVANMQAQQVARQHQMDLLDKEYVDKHNAAAQTMYNALKDAGGVAPVDGKLPEDMSASDLSQAYVKDPSVRMAPQGYTRHFFDKTDASELTFNGKQWTTADGKPVDMADKTSIQVLDVPDDAMKTKKPIDGTDLNKIAGYNLFDPKKSYSVAPLDLIALNTTRMKDDAQKNAAALEVRKVQLMGEQIALDAKKLNHQVTMDNRAEFEGADKDISERISTLQKQLADPMIMGNKDVTNQIRGQIKDATDELTQIREKLYPNTKISKVLGESGGASNALPSVDKFGQGLSPTATQAYSAAVQTSPNLATARINLAKIPSSQLPDAERQSILAALEKHYQAQTEQSAQQQNDQENTRQRGVKAETQNFNDASKQPNSAPSPAFAL